MKIFLGLYYIPDTSANAITMAIKNCSVHMNLQWSRCRGRCYDGAASMAGCRTGVANLILSMELQALYTHCFGRSLNLAMCDTTYKEVQINSRCTGYSIQNKQVD